MSLSDKIIEIWNRKKDVKVSAQSNATIDTKHRAVLVNDLKEAIKERLKRTAEHYKQLRIDILNSQDKEDVLQNLKDFIEVQDADDLELYGEELCE